MGNSSETELLSPFKGMQYLTTAEFEKRYSYFNKKNIFFSEQGWSNEIKDKGLFIDLSQVRWVDIGASAQLVLMVESAVKVGIRITAALPLVRLSKGEKEFLDQQKFHSEENFKSKQTLFESLRNAREEARNYLSNIQFQTAILCKHISENSVILVDEHDFESSDLSLKTTLIENPDDETERIIATIKKPQEIQYKFIIPLTWISPIDKTDNFEFLETKLSQILSQSERGLDAIDALAIKNVIISELVKNVHEHASSSGVKKEFALIGVVLQPTRILRSKYFPTCERDYFEFISKTNSNYISIYFGDTGDGLVKTLKPAYSELHTKKTSEESLNVIEWSFDKWSTRKINEPFRGTKGIYRIKRIINKYDGLITIRTADKIGGYQKGGEDVPRWIYSNTNDGLSYFPGTFVRMQLSPFKELLKFNVAPDPTDTKTLKNFEWRVEVVNVRSVNPSDTFKENFSLPALFKNPEINILLITQFDLNKLPNLLIQKEAIRNHLLYLCEGRHPNGVAVYGLPTGWEQIENEIDSINESLQLDTFVEQPNDYKVYLDPESIHHSKENVCDPVLVLGDKQQFAWVGIENEKNRQVITELYSSDLNQVSLSDLSSFRTLTEYEKLAFKKFCSGDTQLISFANTILSRRFNFRSLTEYFSKNLLQKIYYEPHSESNKGKYYVTPNLRSIRNWIALDRIISEMSSGYALALSATFRDKIKLPQSISEYKILIDNHETLGLANAFAKWMGISTSSIINILDEVDGRLPRRNPIFEAKDQVIILTTIVSSAETAKRLLKTILRDLANPVAILTLINEGKETSVECWNTSIEIISLLSDINYDISREEIQTNSLKPIYIEPLTYKKVIRSNTPIGQEDELESFYNLIVKERALHFNHVGKSNGRHFTFYLSASRLLKHENSDCETLVYEKYFSTIDEWLKKFKKKNFEIWRPTPDMKLSHPVFKIANRILNYFNGEQQRGHCERIVEIKRATAYGLFTFGSSQSATSESENVAIIDWGSLTGTTVQQMINLAANDGKQNILVCILFSQLSTSENEFLTSLTKVYGYKKQRKNKPSLFDPIVVKRTEPRILVKFLYRLPLQFYESIECPICEQIFSLRKFEIRGEHMDDFNGTRRNSLKIKNREITNEIPVDFYESELDSALILEMFKFRVLLQGALFSTIEREKVKLEIEDILENFDEQKESSNSKLYAVLYLLSIENMWLQKPPLVFRQLREMLTEAAFRISIWKREEMNFYISDPKMLIRFKFASISVLRSSDKNKFISCINEVFISAGGNNNFSRSITQNLFYHTHSFLNRSYHTQEKDYNTIIQELSKIKATSGLTYDILYVITFLINLTEVRKTSSKPSSEKTKIEIFKSLKNTVVSKLNEPHSYIFDLFRKIGPSYVDQFFRQLQNEPNAIKIRSNLKNWINDALHKWAELCGFISTVYDHLTRLSGLMNSTLFQDYYISTFLSSLANPTYNEELIIGYEDKFTQSLIELKRHPENKAVYEQYYSLYKILNIYLFNFKPKEKQFDSRLKNLFDEFPASVQIILNDCKEAFELKHIKSHPEIFLHFDTLTDYQVFFPSTYLNWALQLILDNVITHTKTKPPDWKIVVKLVKTDKFISIIVQNNGSPSCQNNPNGGLALIKRQVEIFEGKLEFTFAERNIVIMNLLNYEY